MKIGIIGSGNMGASLGKRWAAAGGHSVLFSYARDPAKLTGLAASVGEQAQAGTPLDAARFGEVVLLTVPWATVPDVLPPLAGTLDGKVLLTCVTPLKADFSGLEIGTTTSAAEEIARLAPSARVVEVLFPFAERLQGADSLDIDGQKATQLFCGDDTKAKAIIALLIENLGLEPLDAGMLTAARDLEHVGMLLVRLAYGQGLGAALGLRLLRG